MLFQGQEFGASIPFLYFADHKGELAEAVAQGTGRVHHAVPQPRVTKSRRPACRRRTTRRRSSGASCNGTNGTLTQAHRRLHADLLALRRDDAAFRSSSRAPSTAPCSATRRSCCGLRRATPATNGCWWSTSGPISSPARLPSRWWRRPTGTSGECAGRARDLRTAASGRPES